MKVKISEFYNSGQRINVTIDKYDTYSADCTLAEIILPLLVQLKHTMHGIPNEFSHVGGEDYEQMSFDFYIESHNDSFNEGVKKWNEVLDKMIWSFQQILIDDHDSLYHHGKVEFDFTPTGEKLFNSLTGKMEDTFLMKSNGSWYDHVGHQLHLERIQEGVNLFAKYYRNLWD